nr:ABC transporter ATP-binding protein [uncultured Blautia sp.]
MEKLLEVKDLKTYFFTPDKTIPAVDGVSFHINKGETLCIVGESGSGKSVTSLSIMQLVPTPPGRYVGGQILFEGEDILKKPESEMCGIRGNVISMIYQEPMTYLNPVFSIGDQLMETLRIHQKLNKKEAEKKAVHMLDLVGISDPGSRMREYPHQLSGGMRQRVMIAMGLSCEPKLLIADEPTTALDVTIQAQILDLMKKLKEELDMTILFITHDLGVVAEMAQRVIVMYGGRVVEEAEVREIFKNPRHPYTLGLLKYIPRMDSRQKLEVIKGMVPSPDKFAKGCRFHPRCPYAKEICTCREPSEQMIGTTRVTCHFPLGTDKEDTCNGRR